MIHQRPGRPSKYLQNGRRPIPPTGGWHSEAVDTPHAREAIALIKEGSIRQTDEPCIVWNRYAQLQVVSPQIFARFLKKCFARANSEAPDNPDIPESSDSLDESASQSSEMSRHSERTTPNRSRTRSSDPPLPSICDSRDSLTFPRCVDAPPNNDGPRLLRSSDEMTMKDQNVAQETEVIEFGDRGYLMLLSMQKGTKTSNYTYRRLQDDTRRGVVAWPRNPLLRNENTLQRELTSGRVGALVNGESVMVHKADPNFKAIQNHVQRRNGETADETEAGDSGNGRNTQVFEFPEPVKAAVSPWSLTREDGTEFEMTGMDEFGPNTIAIFVEKESYGGNAVSKVKSRTPRRTPPRPRHTPPRGPNFPHGPGGGSPYGGGPNFPTALAGVPPTVAALPLGLVTTMGSVASHLAGGSPT
ncbi:hypothetical protein THAOC_35873, partial [Thalassiosira oceanica]